MVLDKLFIHMHIQTLIRILYCIKLLTQNDHGIKVKPKTIQFIEDSIEENLGFVKSPFHFQKPGRFQTILSPEIAGYLIHR